MANPVVSKGIKFFLVDTPDGPGLFLTASASSGLSQCLSPFCALHALAVYFSCARGYRCLADGHHRVS